MEQVAVPGARLSSLVLGTGRGRPVVMLHGLVTGNMAGWYFSVALALSQARQVVLYDQRGHGDSSLAPGDGFSLARQVDDLDAVLVHHGLGDCAVDLAGHSMGALIALHFALRRPDRVRRVVLVDAPMPARDHVGPGLLEVTTPDASPDGRRQRRQRERLQALLTSSTLVDDVLAMGPEPEAALRALARPVLLVYGRRSACLAAGHHLHGLLPQSELVLVDGGHELLEEAPGALRREIERFLGGDPS